MKSGTMALWEIHGRPVNAEAEDTPGERCWVCGGEAERSIDRESWQGANFVGQNRVRCPESGRVCEPCIFVMSRISPVLGRPPGEGKKYGGSFANYSHLYESGGFYANASKGEKPAIRAFLRRQHATDWFAAIADSGQKHVVPWVPMNPPGQSGLVLFDETIVRVNGAVLMLVDWMTDLLTAGATKEEITTGAYGTFSWMRCPDAVRRFEGAWGHKRGGAEFGLAIWLAQRDEEKVAARQAAEKEEREAKKQARKSDSTKKRKEKRDDGAGEASAGAADRGSADGDPRRVPGDAGVQRAEALGPAAVEDASGVADVLVGAGVGDGAAQGAAAPRAAQLDLFGALAVGRDGGAHPARPGRVARPRRA